MTYSVLNLSLNVKLADSISTQSAVSLALDVENRHKEQYPTNQDSAGR